MCNAWNHPPDCTCGWGGEGHLGRGGGGGGNFGTTLYSPPPSNAQWSYDDDYCAPSTCPKCHAEVFFIRHNGGSVWVDELRWPWPKHACFNESQDPSGSWLIYIGKHISPTPERRLLFGIITHAKWISEGDGKPTRIVLAVDGGNDGRLCIATPATNTADYLLGRVAVVDVMNKVFVTSNHDTRPIMGVRATPDELGLPKKWQTFVPSGRTDA